jgi:hypothetical protein
VDMESEAEHWEVLKEKVAVKSSGTIKKRLRGRHLAVGLRGEPRELCRGDSGSRRKLAASCKKVSHRVRVAWRKRNIVRDKWTRAKAERGIRRVRTLMERLRTRHEGRHGVKDLDGARPRYQKKRDLKKLRRESTRNVNETLRKTTGLEIAKQIVRSTVGLRTIEDRTYWRGRPSPKRKKTG